MLICVVIQGQSFNYINIEIQKSYQFHLPNFKSFEYLSIKYLWNTFIGGYPLPASVNMNNSRNIIFNIGFDGKNKQDKFLATFNWFLPIRSHYSSRKMVLLSSSKTLVEMSFSRETLAEKCNGKFPLTSPVLKQFTSRYFSMRCCKIYQQKSVAEWHRSNHLYTSFSKKRCLFCDLRLFF